MTLFTRPAKLYNNNIHSQIYINLKIYQILWLIPAELLHNDVNGGENEGIDKVC